jgi:hypothetical protein
LASYGADSAHTVRHAAIFVDKILECPYCRIVGRRVLVQDWFLDQRAQKAGHTAIKRLLDRDLLSRESCVR